MKMILRRLRRLEEVAVPDEKEQLMVQAIIEARRRRPGPDYEPITFPAESYEGCRTIGDHLIRARKQLMRRCKGLHQLNSD